MTDTLSAAYSERGHDAQRLTQTTNALGKLTRRAYDANGNPIAPRSTATTSTTACAAPPRPGSRRPSPTTPRGGCARRRSPGRPPAVADDGTDLIAEYSSGGTLLRRYVHGPGVDEPLVVYEGSGTTSKTWLYADHLGSIVGQANSAGTSTATYRYGPFGEPDVTTGQRFRYTGQPLIGALGLYYYKARFTPRPSGASCRPIRSGMPMI